MLAAARDLLRRQSFTALTVDGVMAQAGLARTVFYRHFDDLAQLAFALLPDAGDPVVAQARRALEAEGVDAAVDAMVDGLVAVFAEHGPLLRGIDEAIRADPRVDPTEDPALAEPLEFIAGLLAQAPHPPPHPDQSARALQAAHRTYLLDSFGGPEPRATPAQARATLRALWDRVLS
jgi:AcrR family transcriptional regulator